MNTQAKRVQRKTGITLCRDFLRKDRTGEFKNPKLGVASSINLIGAQIINSINFRIRNKELNSERSNKMAGTTTRNNYMPITITISTLNNCTATTFNINLQTQMATKAFNTSKISMMLLSSPKLRSKEKCRGRVYRMKRPSLLN